MVYYHYHIEINGEEFQSYDISTFAVAGGNDDFIRLLIQKNIKFSDVLLCKYIVSP